MNIHEYQAKELLRSYAIPLLPGLPAENVEDALSAGKAIGGSCWVVKAQIHAGGRGKAGGIKIARTRDELKNYAAALLGKPLVTHQTGPKGQLVRKLYIESPVDIAREIYLALTVDRTIGRITFLAAAEGGMEIESNSGGIKTFTVDPAVGYSGYIGAQIAAALKLKGDLARHCAELTRSLYMAFTEKDMSLLELNPLAITRSDEMFALDAKIIFDDNALYRHPDVRALRDPQEEDPAETAASEIGVSFIKLDGNIGCMVNGAGLAMSTMDIIKHFGGLPANFLDVGGGATTEQVTESFRLILSDAKVRGVLVNIFGGIMKCDVIAQGIVAALDKLQPNLPVVVRLAGTNVEEGNAILSQSSHKLIPASDLNDAAKKIVSAVREISGGKDAA